MIFSKYIKSRIRVIIFFVFMLLIFAFITMLAGIPWNVSLYAGLLQLFFALIIGSIDYFRFLRYINILKDCENNLMYTARTDLPPRDLIDEEYQRLYAEVHDMLIEEIKERESLESGLNDYYKTWVHQIKTPLSALYLIVQNSSIEEKNEMWMQLARIDGYLDMLLKFIKLASDNTDFVFQNYNVQELVKEVVKSQSIVFIKKKLSIELNDLDENIVTDKMWLGFIIDQVLSNALKYTNEGGVVVSLKSTTSEKIISIADSGIGIRASDISRIFEDGFTGYNGRTSSKSSGIGLYLCRKIADKLGYRLSAESKLGEGTKINIHIPYSNVRYE